METKGVKIKVVKETGGIEYTPPAAHAIKQDAIQWTCESGPFALQFLGETPVDFQRNHSAAKEGAGACVLKGVVRDDARAGAYQYGCSVFVDGIVYLDARCPVIIIDI